MEERIVFDDWLYRPKALIKQKKAEYLVFFILLWILFLASVIGMLFSLYSLLFLSLSICANIGLMLEYLKIRNHHLVITDQAIYMTNRFNKTKKYLLNYKDCSLEIKESVKRGGGIWMKFYDPKGTLLLKYEDMLNTPTMYGGRLLP